MSACFSGRLGDACSADDDCPKGVGCYLPAQGGPGVCSVACKVEASCSDGVCTTTSAGLACTRPCDVVTDCDDGAPCQKDQNGAPVCWIEDVMMHPAPDGLAVDRVESTDDYGTTEGARVRMGSAAKLLIYLRNLSGTNAYEQPRTEVEVLGTDLAIERCEKPYEGEWTECEGGCVCNLDPWSRSAIDFSDSVLPGQRVDSAALAIVVTAPAATSTGRFWLRLTFHGMTGNGAGGTTEATTTDFLGVDVIP